MPSPARLHPPEFTRAMAQGALVGALVLCAAFPWLRSHPLHRAAIAPPVASVPALPSAVQPGAVLPKAATHGPLADFRGVEVSRDVRQVANWAFFTRDNHRRSVVILDKKAATVYVFDPAGRLVSNAPVLLGLARGDDTEPGLGDKPLSRIRDDEKTTPAGRFVAEPGENNDGEDIVWIDYDQALAMHRVVRGTPAERRAQRLASPDPRERRISFGCINLPPRFYDRILSPAVKKTGAIVYVLPEIKTTQQVFGAWDVTDPSARPPAHAAGHTAVAAARSHPPRAYREAP